MNSSNLKCWQRIEGEKWSRYENTRLDQVLWLKLAMCIQGNHRIAAVTCKSNKTVLRPDFTQHFMLGVAVIGLWVHNWGNDGRVSFDVKQGLDAANITSVHEVGTRLAEDAVRGGKTLVNNNTDIAEWSENYRWRYCQQLHGWVRDLLELMRIV